MVEGTLVFPNGVRKHTYSDWLRLNIAGTARLEVKGNRLLLYMADGTYHLSTWPSQQALWEWLQNRYSLVGCPMRWNGRETTFRLSKQTPDTWEDAL